MFWFINQLDLVVSFKYGTMKFTRLCWNWYRTDYIPRHLFKTIFPYQSLWEEILFPIFLCKNSNHTYVVKCPLELPELLLKLKRLRHQLLRIIQKIELNNAIVKLAARGFEILRIFWTTCSDLLKLLL